MLTVVTDLAVELFPRVAPPERPMPASFAPASASEAPRRHDEHRARGVRNAVPAHRTPPRAQPTAPGADADDQQIVILPGLVNQAYSRDSDVHDEAHRDANRRPAESLIDAGCDQDLSLAVE